VDKPCRKRDHYKHRNAGKNEPCLCVYRIHVYLLS
jgi:hypothetical protein